MVITRSQKRMIEGHIDALRSDLLEGEAKASGFQKRYVEASGEIKDYLDRFFPLAKFVTYKAALDDLKASLEEAWDLYMAEEER